MDAKKKKLVISAAVIAAVLLAAGVFIFLNSEEKSHTYHFIAMGSPVDVTLFGSQEECDGVFDLMKNAVTGLDEKYISAKQQTSEIGKLNMKGELDSPSEMTVEAVKKTLEVCRASGGALDLTVGGLTKLWDFDGGSQIVPSGADIQKELGLVNYSLVFVTDKKIGLEEGQRVDLGAVGKGYACDIAGEILRGSGVTGAVVSVGGTVLTYGQKGDGDTWSVAVRSPEPESTVSDTLGILRLKGGVTVSTSGGYEKFFYKDGEMYHHILDPETGMPADSGLKSVTVVCDCGLYADALSTACFILGAGEGADLLAEFGARAVFVTDDGRVIVSDGLKDSFELTDDSYSYE